MSNESDPQKEIEDLKRKLAAAEAKLANQSGSGAIAKDDGTAAGERGVAVGGDVYGNIYTGDAPANEAEALTIYRQVFAASCRQLPLRGVDFGGSDPSSQRIDLDQVYIDLNTQRGVSALSAAANYRRLVLLGGPGSGKSTFLNHLGLCLALHAAEPEMQWLNRLAAWPKDEGALIPVTIVLRDYATAHSQTTEAASPKHLWTFITEQLTAQNLDFVIPILEKGLDEGIVLIILDGLDEIPTASQRTFVRDSVAVFSTRYPKIRMLVTCRMLSYQDPAWQLEGFMQATLAAFNDEKIDRFIVGWYSELERLNVVRSVDVGRLVQRLQEAVTRPELQELAQTPLLLTVMALVHTHEGRLPDARALLYERTIDILLWRWEEIKVGQSEDAPTLRHMLQEVGCLDVDLKRTLWQLAFDAHQKTLIENQSGLADIDELTLQNALTELHPDASRDWAYSLIQAIKMRAGLLLERVAGTYTFPHRTFQEYLAGAKLASSHEFAKEVTALTADSAFWKQVILLAVGRLVYEVGDFEKPIALAGELAPAEKPKVHLPSDNTLWQQIWLAGEVLNEVGLNRVKQSNLGCMVLRTTQQRLIDLIEAGGLTPIARADAATTLAKLGDPRFDPDFYHLPTEPNLGFIDIPAATFLMGSDRRVDQEALDRELPQHEVDLERFLIGRYQVTVAQWWTYCQSANIESEDTDSLRDADTNPVRYVTWDEAMDYCRWLTETLRHDINTSEPLATLLREGDGDGRPWQIVLPSEAQWERVARDTDGRIYPWGNEFYAGLCNTSETGIGRPVAVGIFYQDQSIEGCLDLAGNLLDWTNTRLTEDYEYPHYPYDAQDGREDLDAGEAGVARGGSFSDFNRLARCAFRSHSDLASSYIGFRVCASPLPSASE